MGFLQQNRNRIIRDGWSRVEITAGNIDKTLIFLSAQLVTENQVLHCIIYNVQSVERRHENMDVIHFLPVNLAQEFSLQGQNLGTDTCLSLVFMQV